MFSSRLSVILSISCSLALAAKMSVGLAEVRAAEAWGMRERSSPGVLHHFRLPHCLPGVLLLPQDRIEPSKQDPD